MELWVGLARTAVKTVGWGFAVWCFYMCVQAVAGTNTTFLAIVQSSFKMSLDRYAAYFLAGIAGLAWYGERLLRKRTIKGQGDYIKKLESEKDPKRSSSGLSRTGEPPRLRVPVEADESGDKLPIEHEEERKEDRHGR